MAEYLIQDTTLTAIADAIREKTGSTGALTPSGMITEINKLVDTSGDTDAPESGSAIGNLSVTNNLAMPVYCGAAGIGSGETVLVPIVNHYTDYIPIIVSNLFLSDADWSTQQIKTTVSFFNMDIYEDWTVENQKLLLMYPDEPRRGFLYAEFEGGLYGDATLEISLGDSI